MGIKRIIKYLIILPVSLISVFLTGCMGSVQVYLPVVSDYEYPAIVEIKDLRVGVVTGPYGGMFTEAVLPSLENKGYKASLVYYDDFVSPNIALANNEIDLNIFQHYTYLNTFKFEHDLALTAVIEIPTISMCVFSRNYNSINELVPGITVAIPDDASNLARALRVLEAMNLITLDPNIDKSKSTIADIIFDPYEIQFKPTSAQLLVLSLDNYDVAVINGNFALSEGLNPLDALYQEVLSGDYLNVVAVRSDDLNKQFVRDIIEVISSAGFRETVTDPDGNYAGFQWPRWLHTAMHETGSGS